MLLLARSSYENMLYRDICGLYYKRHSTTLALRKRLAPTLVEIRLRAPSRWLQWTNLSYIVSNLIIIFMCQERYSFRAQQWHRLWDSCHSIIERATLFLLTLVSPRILQLWTISVVYNTDHSVDNTREIDGPETRQPCCCVDDWLSYVKTFWALHLNPPRFCFVHINETMLFWEVNNILVCSTKRLKVESFQPILSSE